MINPPELIFELGKLQVFHYPTPEEKASKAAPSKVFWQDSVSRHTYGPFPDTYHAMTHYTWLVSQQKSEANQDGNVIYMDFVMKRRIKFGV
jgi:hypothetical protein